MSVITLKPLSHVTLSLACYYLSSFASLAVALLISFLSFPEILHEQIHNRDDAKMKTPFSKLIHRKSATLWCFVGFSN